jgi:hypothetical protein
LAMMDGKADRVFYAVIASAAKQSIFLRTT